MTGSNEDPAMKRKHYISLICVLSLLLAVLLAVALGRGPELPEATENTGNTTLPPASSQQTEPKPSQTESVPTEPTVTDPPANSGDMIGCLYTRDELEAMENEFHGYDPGQDAPGVRPAYPQKLNKEFREYDTWFIGPDDNRVYLTFSCAYEGYLEDGTPITGLVLDVLKEKNVKAVFFLCRLYCINSPELVRRMIDEGHIIANHGSRHRSMPKQTVDGMVKDIMELDAYLKEHFGYTMKIYRPASGEYSTRVLAVAQSLGYISYLYSFSYRDFDTENPPSYEYALKTMKDRLHPGAIYQIHTVVETTPNVLGDFIDHIRAQGYETALLPEAGFQ